MEFKLTDYAQFPNISGIYKITNLVNGKNYIGQAKNLRIRLKAHYFIYKRGGNKRMVLYKAITKYGVENFSVSIIETIDNYDVTILDKLEMKYIEKYNSFGATGYNQTKGGDGGVLGYRHNEETLDKLAEITRERYRSRHSDKSLWPRAKNWVTGKEFTACTMKELCKLTGLSRDSVLKCLTKKKNNVYGIWTFARNGEPFPEIESKPKIDKSSIIEEVFQYYIKHPELTRKEIAEYFHICSKTVSSYIKKYKND